MVALAPIPVARIAMTVIANPGFFLNWRKEWLKSAEREENTPKVHPLEFVAYSERRQGAI